MVNIVVSLGVRFSEEGKIKGGGLEFNKQFNKTL